MMSIRITALLLLWGAMLSAPASVRAEADASTDADADALALQQSVEQLRAAVGRWNVITRFLKADGSVQAEVPGSYEFKWVVQDRVLVGRSDIPELDAASGLLFYIRQRGGVIEMVSVAEDGKLWVMTGPLGGETRYSQKYEAADGSTAQLRFTRFNVEPDRFESKMEYSSDAGKTWVQGNHQLFTRVQ